MCTNEPPNIPVSNSLLHDQEYRYLFLKNSRLNDFRRSNTEKIIKIITTSPAHAQVQPHSAYTYDHIVQPHSACVLPCGLYINAQPHSASYVTITESVGQQVANTRTARLGEVV